MCKFSYISACGSGELDSYRRLILPTFWNVLATPSRRRRLSAYVLSKYLGLTLYVCGGQLVAARVARVSTVRGNVSDMMATPTYLRLRDCRSYVCIYRVLLRDNQLSNQESRAFGAIWMILCLGRPLRQDRKAFTIPILDTSPRSPGRLGFRLQLF